MRKFLLSAAFASLATVAVAQPFPNVPPGQTAGATLSQYNFLANSPTIGFQESAFAPAVVGAGNNQATATLLTARNNVVTCTSGTGVQLPAIQRYVPVVILNRGSAACLVYPTLGGYVETAPGTLAAVNVSSSLSAGADVTFKPAIIAGLTEWLQ